MWWKALSRTTERDNGMLIYKWLTGFACEISTRPFSFDIRIVLHQHPGQTDDCNRCWNSPGRPWSCRPIDEAFAHKMCKGHNVCPDRQLVPRGLINMIGGEQ